MSTDVDPPGGPPLYMVTAEEGDLSAACQAIKARCLESKENTNVPSAAAEKRSFASVAGQAQKRTRPLSDKELLNDVIIYGLELEPEYIVNAHWTSPAGPLYMELKQHMSEEEDNTNSNGIRYRHTTEEEYVREIFERKPHGHLVYTVVIEHSNVKAIPNIQAHKQVAKHVATIICEDEITSDMCLTEARYDALRPQPATVLYMHGPRKAQEDNAKVKKHLDKMLRQTRKRGPGGIRVPWNPKDTKEYNGSYIADLHVKSIGRVFYTKHETKFVKKVIERTTIPSKYMRDGTSFYLRHDFTRARAHAAQAQNPTSIAMTRERVEAPQPGRQVREQSETRVADGAAHPSAKEKRASTRRDKKHPPQMLSAPEPAGGCLDKPVAIATDAGSTEGAHADPGTPTQNVSGEEVTKHTGGTDHPMPQKAGNALASPPNNTPHPPRQSEVDANGEGDSTREQANEAVDKGTALPLKGKGGHTGSDGTCQDDGQAHVPEQVVPGRTPDRPQATSVPEQVVPGRTPDRPANSYALIAAAANGKGSPAQLANEEQASSPATQAGSHWPGQSQDLEDEDESSNRRTRSTARRLSNTPPEGYLL